MKKNLPKYCWDTTVFVAWLNRQSNAPLGDIDAVLDDVVAGRAMLIVPVTVYTEIVRAKHAPQQIRAFDAFLSRSTVRRADGSFNVAKKAEQIRSRGHTLSRRGEARNIKTPDATIIATAILFEVDALHSLEPRHHRLSGTKIVEGLKICSPVHVSGQRALELGWTGTE
jgi:predicted nucleic acid-binding protein